MQNETKVDVLAVMDRAAGLHWDHEENADAEDMEAARAAVAELIEAADKLQRIYHLMDADPDFIRLRAAIARIGGAK